MTIPRKAGVVRNRRGRLGFTLLEMMIVIAVIAIVSAIVIPPMISWMGRTRLNSAVMEIVSLIQKARIEAVRRNTEVVVLFDLENNAYTSFVDDGQDGGIACNGIQDGAERFLHQGRLPGGVIFSSVSLGLGRNKVSFNARAIPKLGGGPIVLTSSQGRTATIRLGSGGIPMVE
ncbi:GspH/FimT family pseudopilin [Desulfosarcina sp. OttesenSCG-928-G17]|nr:GspH/FimT family pseudopilin [Desulfosarcina sp. OttesenSCG-928-G17]